MRIRTLLALGCMVLVGLVGQACADISQADAQALVQGKSVPEAVAFGLACGAANALTPTAGCVHSDDVQRLLAQVRVS